MVAELRSLEPDADLQPGTPVGLSGLAGRSGRELLEKREDLAERRRLVGKAEDRDAPRHAYALHVLAPPALKLHEADLVRVDVFVERERQRRARVADVATAAHLLGEVEVAKRDVVDIGREDVDRQRVLVPSQDLPLALVREAHPLHVAVTRRDEGLAVLPLRAGGVQRTRVDPADAVDDARGGRLAPGKVAQPQERDGRHPGRDLAGTGGALAERDDESLDVDLPFGTREEPHDVHRESRQDRSRRLEPRRRVVVAGHDDDLQAPAPAARVGQEAVPAGQRRGGRVGPLEDVAADEKGVDALLLEEVEEPVEERPVLRLAVPVVEGMAQVPVGRVDDPHHSSVGRAGLRLSLLESGCLTTSGSREGSDNWRPDRRSFPAEALPSPRTGRGRLAPRPATRRPASAVAAAASVSLPAANGSYVSPSFMFRPPATIRPSLPGSSAALATESMNSLTWLLTFRTSFGQISVARVIPSSVGHRLSAT